MSKSIEQLKRERPRNRFARWSAATMLGLVIVSWSSDAFSFRDLGSESAFVIGGASFAAESSALAPISDFASIQHWLIAGPFLHPCDPCAAPGETEITRDYLSDGITTEADLEPRAGDLLDGAALDVHLQLFA